MSFASSVAGRITEKFEPAWTGLERVANRFDIDDPVWREVCARMRAVPFAQNDLIAREGEHLDKYFVVLKGTVRCEKSSPLGRQIYLSRVGNGQSCAVAATCLLNDLPLMADAIGETDGLLGTMSIADFRRCMDGSAGFRRFLFSGFASQVGGILSLVKDLAFNRIDVRLAQFLLSSDADIIKYTHQDLANELGTAREVVSRTIKTFREAGWISVQRGTVRIIDREALGNLLPSSLN